MERSLYSKKYECLREWLKAELKKQPDLSMRMLSEKLNVHHSIIGKIEQGERKLDIVEYVDYCEALGSDPLVGTKVIQSS